MALAALRPDRAARALCRRELRPAAETLSLLSRGLGVPQREAGSRALPPVHAIRRRHGRLGVAGGGCGNLHDGRRLPGGVGDQARRLCDQGQQSQGARRGHGGDRARGRGKRRAAADRFARNRQARQAWRRRRALALGVGAQGRERRFHQGRGAKARGYRRSSISSKSFDGSRVQEWRRSEAGRGFASEPRSRGLASERPR